MGTLDIQDYISIAFTQKRRDKTLLHEELDILVPRLQNRVANHFSGSHLQRTGETIAPSFFSSAKALNRATTQHNVPQRVEEIFIDFIRLLPQHFAEHHDIAFYASALNISPVYLSRIVRQVTGRTVIDYINQHLLMEASYLLRTTSLSITQIADQLHFADTPSFSKFFSRNKGVSPKDYRK